MDTRCWSNRQKLPGKFGVRPMESDKQVRFGSTEIAFAYKNNRQLKLSYWLFRLMSRPSWADFFAKIGSLALHFRLPLTQYIIRRTMYRQFIGGETLQDCLPVIENLSDYHCLVVLDYAVEGKNEEEELDLDRKSTRLNSSHVKISYAVVCLKQKI